MSISKIIKKLPFKKMELFHSITEGLRSITLLKKKILHKYLLRIMSTFEEYLF